MVSIYLILRAIYVPLFNDEIITFNHFIHTGFISPYNEYKAANNHILNSFLSHYSYLLFGSSPLSLRLASVLSFIPFAIYVYKIGGFIKNKIPKWGFYIALLIPVNFIAFFSLSRGYGLSYAFIMANIFYNCKTFEINNIKNIFFGVIICKSCHVCKFFCSIICPYYVWNFSSKYNPK